MRKLRRAGQLFRRKARPLVLPAYEPEFALWMFMPISLPAVASLLLIDMSFTMYRNLRLREMNPPQGWIAPKRVPFTPVPVPGLRGELFVYAAPAELLKPPSVVLHIDVTFVP